MKKKTLAFLNRNSKKPRFRQIQDHILARIADGSLAPGDRLPPLRKWAGDMGVAYETMLKAIRELVSAGVLSANRRRGTVVAGRGRSSRGKVGAIGVITYGTYEDLMKGSPYYSHLMPLVQDKIMAHHERVIYERWATEKNMSEMFDHLRLVDGVLILGNAPYPTSQIKAIQNLGVPAVCAGGQIEDEEIWVVRSDDFEDSRHAVKELVRMGHQKIAAYTTLDDPRCRGYMQGLADTGLPFRPEYVVFGRPSEVVERLMALQFPPTALFITRSFDKVPGMVEAFRERGLRPGYDIYFCSYDEDLWNNLAPLGIPYARIEQPIRKIAEAVVRVLLALIEGRPAGPVHTFLRSRFVTFPASNPSRSS